MRFGLRWTAAALVFAAGCVAFAIKAVPEWAHGPRSATFRMAVVKADYKRPPPRPVADPALVDLGRDLFWDPRVSASATTSCVSCHQPWLGWASTDARDRSDSGKSMLRKSQPLLGVGHAGGEPVGWDGRTPTIEAHIASSMAAGAMSGGQTDAPVRVEVVEARIRAVPAYARKFAAALPGATISTDTIALAIAAYVRTFEPGIAPFDRWIEGDEDAISPSARRGFVLFNTRGNCAACHNGWRFTDDGFHDIGVATADLGRGQFLKDIPAMRFAFKTPTLRSVALRPPYMHDGSLTRLYDVIRLYEKGGIDRPSRAAGIYPLQLGEQDRLDLVAFLQTLTGVQEGEPPPRLPDLN